MQIFRKSPFKLYTNPSEGTFTISSPNLLNYKKLIIFNLKGELVLNQTLSALKEVTINKVNTPGRYCIFLKSDKKTTTLKMIIK